MQKPVILRLKHTVHVYILVTEVTGSQHSQGHVLLLPSSTTQQQQNTSTAISEISTESIGYPFDVDYVDRQLHPQLFESLRDKGRNGFKKEGFSGIYWSFYGLSSPGDSGGQYHHVRPKTGRR